jgi:hypothetical protein
MSKRLLIFTAFFFHATLLLLAQKRTYEAPNGKQVDVEIVNDNPDEGRNASIFVGFFGPQGVNLLGANYYKPKSYFINGLIGPASGQVDVSLFLRNTVKPTVLRQSVAMEGRTKYMVRVFTEKRKSLGLHGGASYMNYSFDGPDYSSLGVFAGVSLLKSKHAYWKISSNYKQAQGTLINRLNADVIYYVPLVRTATPAATGTVGYGEPERTYRKVGARVYYDGKATLWSRGGRVSFNYMLGVGINEDKQSLPFFAGLGLGYNFL